MDSHFKRKLTETERVSPPVLKRQKTDEMSMEDRSEPDDGSAPENNPEPGDGERDGHKPEEMDLEDQLGERESSGGEDDLDTLGSPEMSDVESLTSSQEEVINADGTITIVTGGVSSTAVATSVRQDTRFEEIQKKQHVRQEALLQRLYVDAMVDIDKTDQELEVGVLDWRKDTGGNWVAVDGNGNVVEEEDSDEDNALEEDDEMN